MAWRDVPHKGWIVGAGLVLIVGAALFIDPAHDAKVAAARAADEADRNAAQLERADALLAQARAAGVTVNCPGREADIPAHVWASLSTTEKRGLTVMVATHCRVPRVTLRDAATARTIATYRGGTVAFD